MKLKYLYIILAIFSIKYISILIMFFPDWVISEFSIIPFYNKLFLLIDTIKNDLLVFFIILINIYF